jgi:hypothetical protein
VLTRTQALAAGVSARELTDLVSCGSIARIARGVYSVGEPLPDPYRVASDWRAVISFESAVAWYGVELPGPVRELHVTLPRYRGRHAEVEPGLRLHRSDLPRWDVALVKGALVTTPLRTALDISRHAPVDDAVAVVDAFIRNRSFTLNDFVSAAREAKGPGRLRIQLVASLVDPCGGSVLESLTRILVWRQGLPWPVTQLSLRSRTTGWVGYVDFAWPDQRAVLECDGYASRSAPDQLRGDRRRWSAITSAGWRLGVVTWFDVTQDPAYVVDLVRGLLGVDGEQAADAIRVAS